MAIAELRRLEVGPWPMNTYLIICPDTGNSALVDPGADPDAILKWLSDTSLQMILITHGHPDHIGALEAVRVATGAPVYIHPDDTKEWGVMGDEDLYDGDTLRIGKIEISVAHTPGHTPGHVCFRFDRRAIVGDVIFPGGPGHTATPEDFAQTIETLKRVIFSWPDDITFYPGHGKPGTIGTERPAFEAFLARGWPPDLHGDVTWE